MVRLILASASPRRRQILSDVGYQFECADPGEVEDSISAAASPELLAIAKARVKAEAIAARQRPAEPTLVIGSDTLVALEGDIIGKPVDRADATAILSRLSGTRHRVISGVCLWPVGLSGKALEPVTFHETTWVRMKPMSPQEIAAYVGSGQSDGKAGAYAIQESGDRFVEALEGSFLNVVGFPLELFQARLPEALKGWNFDF